VSGARLWGFFRDTFGTADAFFARAFVANYCPLVFVEEGGANRTPDKLPRAEREALFRACDAALADVIRVLAPSRVVGVGAFAEAAAQRVVTAHGLGVPVGTILHPSPASPRANRGWANEARVGLEAQGLAWWPSTRT
jgi:single-strand selective monofunctional uracil DNA glycosylase